VPAFFLTFLAVALALLAGRESVRVARLSAARGGAIGLWLAFLAAGFSAAILAAVLAGELEKLLEPELHGWLVAAALTVAGIEVLALTAPPRPREAAQSVVATLLVIFTELITGAAGLLVIALGVALDSRVMAGAGGALGAMAALSMAALAQDDWEKLPHRALRLAGGGVLLIAAMASGLSAL
jgi:Ca2+/H+ antiporter, TMEM165/GDT1 family